MTPSYMLMKSVKYLFKNQLDPIRNVVSLKLPHNNLTHLVGNRRLNDVDYLNRSHHFVARFCEQNCIVWIQS